MFRTNSLRLPRLLNWTLAVSLISYHWEMLYTEPGRGRGGLRLIFAGYVPLASQSPYPIIVYSVINYRPYLTFGQICNFWNPNLVTSYFYELQPSKLKFLLGRHLATTSFGSGKLFYKSVRRLQTFRCHSDQNGHNLEGWIDPFLTLNEEHFTFHLPYKHSGMFANRKIWRTVLPQTIRKCATP